MRLIHSRDRDFYGISFKNIEAPFFARSKVENALYGHTFQPITGLDVTSHGVTWNREKILEAVADGTLLLVTDNPFSPLSNDVFGEYDHITAKGKFSGFYQALPDVLPPATGTETAVKPEVHEPGFYVVPKTTTLEALKAALFTSPEPGVMDKFLTLNPNLNEIKAGTMIVLSDPNNLQCTKEESLLLEAASVTNKALEELSPEEAEFLVRHRDEIESFLSAGGTGMGVGAAVFSSHLKGVRELLDDIDALHKRTFEAHGHLRSPEFFLERNKLFSKLNVRLTGLTRKGAGIPDHPSLKRALGISSRSLVHRWTKAGAPDQIPGYATHIDGVARASKYIKYGGWVGTAVGGGASVMKVQDVCAAGDAEACRKVKFKEGGSFFGSTIGGAAAGALLTAPIVGSICVGLGVPTAGVGSLVCGAVVVGVGVFGASATFGTMAEKSAALIFERTK